MADCLAQLAPRHPQTKFVKIISYDCIANYPDANLPTVLLYHNGECCKTFAGLTIWGGKRASPECAVLSCPLPKDFGSQIHSGMRVTMMTSCESKTITIVPEVTKACCIVFRSQSAEHALAFSTAWHLNVLADIRW